MLDQIVLFIEILLINLVLSGDNAVVIAMASKDLPAREQKQAVWWGAFGAIALRLLLILVAVTMLQIPYIQTVGSFLLLWIAFKLLLEQDGISEIRQAPTLMKAIWTIIVADFIMSLDNVLAIAAMADNQIGIIMLGIGLSIPIIIWGSTFVMKLLSRFPVVVFIGSGILGYTAGEMFISDVKVAAWLPPGKPHWVLPVLAAISVIAAGLTKRVWVQLTKKSTM